MKKVKPYVLLWKDCYRDLRSNSVDILTLVGNTGCATFLADVGSYREVWNRYCSSRHLRQGQTREGQPYFLYMGVKFILLYGDKLENVNLLK